jgi:6-pyruvoyltetrahydropterin/6-carboxytetrahydropterin synthase
MIQYTEEQLQAALLAQQNTPKAKYYSTKHYGHNIGLSAVFRQPNADHSHCHLLHGYSLAFTFTFGCDTLDNKNWAVDFGGLKAAQSMAGR